MGRKITTPSNFFGSGWVWLSVNSSRSLVLESFPNTDNPLLVEHTPLRTCDVSKHAYYIDYRNTRVEYLAKWCELIDWDFVTHNLEAFSKK